MHKLDMRSTSHKLEKQNLVTLKDIHGFYDEYECALCGIRGRKYWVSSFLTIDGRLSKSKVRSCPKVEPPERIKITTCNAFGDHFVNITPGSVHDVVPTPKGQNDEDGVWVMGSEEPVKVLFGEFTTEEK